MFSFLKRRRRDDLSVVKRLTRDAHLRHRVNLSAIARDGAFYVLVAVAFSAIAFLGRPPHAPVVQLHQRPKFSYEARFDFSYESKLRLESLRAAARMSVLPVFRVNADTVDARVTRYREFARELASLYETLSALPEEQRVRRIAELPSVAALGGSPRAVASSASTAVAAAGSGSYLEFLFGDALQQFDDLCRRGIYDESTFGGGSGGDAVVRLLRDRSRRHELHVAEARKLLGTNVYYQAAGDAQPGFVEQENARRLARAIADIIQNSLLPNIDADPVRTESAREAAAAAVVARPETVPSGTLLIERDIEVTPLALERWRAYRDALAQREQMDFGFTRTLLRNTVAGIAIVGAVLLFSRVFESREVIRTRALALAVGAAFLNLALLRLGLEFSESGIASRLGGEATMWGGVFVLAPLLAAVLVGPYLALISIFLVSGFAAAMYGNSLDMLLVIVLASLVAVLGVRGARSRSRVVTAGLLSSAPVALIAWYQVSACAFTVEALRSSLAALVSGLLSGAIAAGLLPFLEKLFKITTDVTLLELSDYNRPLLRKLQLIAPGTFHHSVMVANLAERAAESIGANPLLCRCAALYHDIGKMVKPEYFIENRREGASPHEDITPSMSAIVIKSHVREGVEIAREYRLPRVITDIIEQHHGTGLISFFYHKARMACHAHPERGGVPEPAADPRGVDESLYRYDGPKPKTREAAVMLLSDSVEAASRSLKKVTPQTVEELVDTIVCDRIADGQFEDCPITFREIRRVRASLKKSLLNALHQRVAYPAGDSPARAGRGTPPPFAAEPSV